MQEICLPALVFFIAPSPVISSLPRLCAGGVHYPVGVAGGLERPPRTKSHRLVPCRRLALLNNHPSTLSAAPSTFRNAAPRENSTYSQPLIALKAFLLHRRTCPSNRRLWVTSPRRAARPHTTGARPSRIAAKCERWGGRIDCEGVCDPIATIAAASRYAAGRRRRPARSQ